jgi:hypothetical protein
MLSGACQSQASWFMGPYDKRRARAKQGRLSSEGAHVGSRRHRAQMMARSHSTHGWRAGTGKAWQTDKSTAVAAAKLRLSRWAAEGSCRLPHGSYIVLIQGRTSEVPKREGAKLAGVVAGGQRMGLWAATWAQGRARITSVCGHRRAPPPGTSTG